MTGPPSAPSGERAPLVGALYRQFEEQVDRTAHLWKRLPPATERWRPAPGAMTVRRLGTHLLESVSGVCAVLQKLRPEELADFDALRDTASDSWTDAADWCLRLERLQRAIDRGFALLGDADLGTVLPSVFAPAGEVALKLFLNNLEHIVNHKHQLFGYLRSLEVAVTSEDLYRYQ